MPKTKKTPKGENPTPEMKYKIIPEIIISGEYKVYIELDRDNLHEEALIQAEITDMIGRAWADAEFNSRLSKIKREEELGILKDRIRKDPESYNLKTNPSESSMEAVIRNIATYKAIVRERIEHERIANIADQAKKAVQARKNMLEVESELYRSEYFARAEGKSTARERIKGLRLKINPKGDW